MPSKVKGKKTVDCCTAPCVGDYKPRLYLDLQDQDVSKLKGLEIGQEATFLVTGKVVGLSQREHERDGKPVKTGSIDLEGFRVEVHGNEDNPFTELSEEDDE
jgi:hypothetical protein